MAEINTSKKSMQRTNCVTLSSSDDDSKQDCMLKIVNTISLQGCSNVSFENEHDSTDITDLLYPKCEIKEENIGGEDGYKEFKDIRKNGFSSASTKREVDEKKNQTKEKKRIQLTKISTIKHHREPKPSTSRRDDTYNVVDARKLAIQESCFKTKELFDTFLRVCQDQENSEQMEKVVEKLSRAYGNARQEFLGSLEFQNILEAETEKVNTSNTKPWLNLKLVLDEMKHNKKTVKLKLGDSEDSQGAGGSNEDEPVIECPKKRRHLKKLEKTLRALNLKIKKLEEREVDWSDDDSAYVKLDRYRSQFTKVYKKVCEIKGKLADADRPYLRKVSFAGTTYPHINRCIERYYNKHREFPDFQDIKKLVTMANEQEKIQMPPIKVHQMAAAAFKEFGEMLKRLRQYDDYDVIISYLDQQVDPAKDNEELQEELNKNALIFRKKEQEVIDKFADQDAGIHSDSGNSSENKPKKKKKKIIITAPRNKPEKPPPPQKSRNHLSSSESSDEEEKDVKTVINKNSGRSLSSDDSSGSDYKTKKSNKKVPVVPKKPALKKNPVVDKGKSIIGKTRIIKGNVHHSTPNKIKMPRTAISSSDEESSPKDTKDSFTNYLGLCTTPLKNEIKTTTIKVQSDEDDISCVEEVQKSSVGNLFNKTSSAKSLSDSEDTKKSKCPLYMEIDDDSDTSEKISDKKSEKDIVCNIDDSDSEPVAIVEKIVKLNSVTKMKKEQRSKSISKTHSVKVKKSSWMSTSSDDSDKNRTSDEDSDKSEKEKSDSDAKLSTGTKDLSPDSSDGEDKKKESDVDDTIVILSEETPDITTPTQNGPLADKNSQDSSDSDDIFILSQESKEMRTVAPRKITADARKPPNNKFKLSSLHSQSPSRTLSGNTNPQRQQLRIATSIPRNQMLKRRLPNQVNIDYNKKTKRCESVSSNGSSSDNCKQTTLPQLFNGAARKTTITRIPRVCRPTNNPDTIPLIELD